MSRLTLVEPYHWEAWEGEVITQMYERTDGDLVIIIETGRAIVLGNPKIYYATVKDAHKTLERQ